MTIIRVITMVFIVGFLSLAFMPTVVHAEQQDRPNAVNVKDFFSNTVYNELKISPTGEYYLINS